MNVERAQAGAVKPVRVVHDQHHRARVRRVTQELKGGQRDAKWVRLEVAGHPKCRLERSPAAVLAAGH